MTDEQNNDPQFKKIMTFGANKMEENWRGAMVDQSLQILIDSPPSDIVVLHAQPAQTEPAQAEPEQAQPAQARALRVGQPRT